MIASRQLARSSSHTLTSTGRRYITLSLSPPRTGQLASQPCSSHRVPSPDRSSFRPRAASARKASFGRRAVHSQENVNSSSSYPEHVASTPRPSSTFLKIRLTSALNADREERSYGLGLLDAVLPLLNPSDSHILDPFVYDISSNLSKSLITHPPPTDRLVDVARVFAFCSIRPQSLVAQRNQSKGKSKFDFRQHVQPYVDYLLSESKSTELERVKTVEKSLEEELATYARAQKRQKNEERKGFRVSLPIAAAWGILRARLSREGEVGSSISDIALPRPVNVIEYIKTNLPSEALNEQVELAVGHLCAEIQESTLPDTVEALERRLSSLVGRGETDTVTSLWSHLLPHLEQLKHRVATIDTPQSTLALPLHSLVNTPNLIPTLTAFLLTFRTLSVKPVIDVSGNPISPAERERMGKLSKQVLSYVPSPTPVSILHVQLSTVIPWSNPEEDLSSETEEAEGEMVLSGRQRAIKALEEVWFAPATVEATKDVKAYMMCITIMGTLKYAEGMVKVWDQMSEDLKCRQATAKERGQDISWPPTEVLNHTLDQLFSMKRTGLPQQAALELYRRAMEPESSLAPNIITINTVLRDAALAGDMSRVNAVLSAAHTLSLEPDIVTYTTLVQGMLRAGDEEGARRTLSVMRDRGIQPNEYMSALLVADLSRNGDAVGLTKAEAMVVEMRKRGVKTTTQMWTSLVAGYFRGGWETDGWNAVQRMQRAGAKLNTITYNVIIRQAGLLHGLNSRTRPELGADWAQQRMSRGQEMGVDERKYDEEESLPMKLFNHMIENKVIPNKDTYAIMLNRTLAMNRMDEAKRVVEKMDFFGFKAESWSLKSIVAKIRKSRGTPGRR